MLRNLPLLGGATARYPGRLGRKASGLGCATHAGGAPQPLRAKRHLVVLPAACAHVAHSCASPHPGPAYALRVVAGATAPGGLRGAPPTSPPKALVDDNACSKRVAPAERWSLLWRHRHALWRPCRLSRNQSSGSGVDRKGAQTTEVVGSQRSNGCVVVEVERGESSS
jgi:hypothetical protein